MNNVLFLLVFIVLASARLVAQEPGTLDSTFGNGGVVMTDFGGDFDGAFALITQPDGKIVVAGYTLNVTSFDFALARYNTDGTLDDTFGIGGKVITNLGGVDQIASMAIQADGKIVVAGSSSYNDGFYYFTLARYNTTGTIDSTFGTNGTIIEDVGIGSDVASSIAIKPNGKILVAGCSYNGINDNFSLVQYDTNGVLDTTFSTDGKLIIDVGNGWDRASSLVIQPDEKIIVAGVSNQQFALFRCNPDGSFDNSFGINGVVFTDMVADHYSVIAAMTIQTDGKIVATGTVSDGAFTNIALARYNTDGTLDNTFDFDGKLTTNVRSGHDYANSVTLQDDGKILVAGSTATDTIFFPNSNFALLRYNTDGSLDDTFGANGVSISNIGITDNFLHSVIMQTDGQILVAGLADLAVGIGFDFVLMRYLSGLNVGVVDFSNTNRAVLFYPNPIMERATLQYTLNKPEVISVSLTDIQGRLITCFFSNQKQAAGSYEKTISLPENLPNGVYCIVISTKDKQIVVKVIK